MRSFLRRGPMPGARTTIALTLFLIAACAPGGGTSSTTAAFDRQFIDMMVPHHQAAIEMAKVAQQRAEHPEIKDMAASINRAQSAEIEQMRAWRREWFGSDQTPTMDRMPMVEGMEGGHGAGGTMDMAMDVEALRGAPEPFDRAFIDSMIAHHQSAVAAGRAAEARASRPEIRELARAIVRGQEREIDQLREWRRAWYPGG